MPKKDSRRGKKSKVKEIITRYAVVRKTVRIMGNYVNQKWPQAYTRETTETTEPRTGTRLNPFPGVNLLQGKRLSQGP